MAGHKCLYFLDNFEGAEEGEGGGDDDQEDGGDGQDPGEHHGGLLTHLITRNNLLQAWVNILPKWPAKVCLK